MSSLHRFNRRHILRGVMGGAAITVGLPLLDCFLNSNGTAFAGGAPLPVCFGNWYQGLGLQPGLWEPKTAGAKYELNSQLQLLSPFRDRLNVFSGMKIMTDGKPSLPHVTGLQVGTTGGIPRGDFFLSPTPSFDTIISDAIGTRTRFRSLGVSLDGTQASVSQRSGSAVNPSEGSPVALYARIFGPDFKDPNAAEFTPEPSVVVRKSVLSVVSENRQSFLQDVGAADRRRLDEYFTSLREIEQQLDLQLQKPAPLEACTVPGKPTEAAPGVVIDDACANAKLFAALLAHAMACGQTQVININTASTGLRQPGSPTGFHTTTHEEPNDPKTGLQPTVTYFQNRLLSAFLDVLNALDGIREGDHTLLDRTVVLWMSDHSYARYHTIENMPLMTVGGANGRIKGGFHIQAQGDPVTRVGLTVMQALGVPINSWGSESNNTSKTITEILA